MRLIIKDYLLELKEKDELDLILCDVLLQMGYTMNSRPKTGNRQYGVDIRADRDDEIILLVVKQKDITRAVWDSGPTSVRQSLEEIKDCYMNIILSSDDLKKRIRVIVATNGNMDEAVQPNWSGYKKGSSVWKNIQIELDFWGIDRITSLIHEYLFDEHIFGVEMQKQLRRALYFINGDDYQRIFYEAIIDNSLAKISPTMSPREHRKSISSLFLATQMIAQYASEAKRYRIAIEVTEYLILKYWQKIYLSNEFEKDCWLSPLYKFLISYEKWNNLYYCAIRPCCEEKRHLPPLNAVQQRVTIYEILSYLVSYGYYLSFNRPLNSNGEKCSMVVNSIVQLINNYPQVLYPPYDRDIGTITMLFRLLDRVERHDDISKLLLLYCDKVQSFHKYCKKFPVPTDSFEDAIQMDFELSTIEYSYSSFWGFLLEWIIRMDSQKAYSKIQSYLNNELKSISLCTWHMRSSEERDLYNALAMNKSGEGIVYHAKESYEEIKKEVEVIFSQFDEEQFSFEKYSFPALEFIVSRYYSYTPRVIREADTNNHV